MVGGNGFEPSQLRCEEPIKLQRFESTRRANEENLHSSVY